MKNVTGGRIKELRRKQHWTQEDLGRKLNVSSQVVSNWERGYTTANSSDVELLAKTLGTTSDYLLGLTNNPTQTLSANAKDFLAVVDLADEEAIKALTERFMYKGQRLSPEQASDILKFARFQLRDKD